MSRQEKRRRRRWHKTRRLCVWTLLMLFELAVAAAPAGITAAVLVPLARTQRGYWAIGGEWLLIAAIFIVAFSAIHNAVCNTLEEDRTDEVQDLPGLRELPRPRGAVRLPAGAGRDAGRKGR